MWPKWEQMEQNKSIENLSEAASLAEQKYIETQQVEITDKQQSCCTA